MSAILLVLSNSFHGRTFVASGVVDMLLARGHRLRVVAREGLAAEVRAALGGHDGLDAVLPLEPYLGGPVRRRLRDAFRTASYVQRSGFSTYRHKLARTPSGWAAARALLARPWARTSWTRAGQALELALIRRLARRRDVEAIARGLEARIPVARAARALLARWTPDVLVAPTTIQDALDTELLKAARRAGVPVIGVPASWDTLTSKGCFLVDPDALLVWGEDTLRHALEHHGMPPGRVFVTGPPHFDVYGPTWPAEPRERFLARRGIDPAKRVVLFAGTTVTYWADEPTQIRALSRAIASGELADCVIWYRPHPRRTARDMREFVGLPGVHVDDVLVAQKERGIGYSILREDLAHYRSLVDACDGVVTAFSTMIIEAALLGKPSLVVAFGLGDHTPERLLQHAEYEHMRDVVSTPGVSLVRSLPELLEGVRRLIAGEFAAYSEALKKRVGEIAHCQDGRARERVVEAIERVAGRAAGR